MAATENVTMRIVGYCATVGALAFVLGGWAGDARANDARHDRELAELRTIAADFRSMVAAMEHRVRSLEDWRTGQPAGR